MTEVSSRMLTVREFVSAYRISKASLYRCWREGEGPDRVQVGRRVLIPIACAEAWVNGLLENSSANSN